MPEFFELDAPVLRIMEDGEEVAALFRDVQIGEKFILDDKIFLATTATNPVGYLASGERVRYQGKWYVVSRHGRDNSLFPLEDSDDPFSTPILSGHSWEAPFPLAVVDVLLIAELRSQAVPRPAHPFRYPAPEPPAVIPEGYSAAVDMRTTSELNNAWKDKTITIE